MYEGKSGEQPRVLIVEDSPSQAAVLAEIVRQGGAEPVVHHELPHGITPVLMKERPDVVILDLRLGDSSGNPTADGFQICREIKRSPLKVPVVVVSAEEDEDAPEWAILQGADAFLRKPVVVEDLAQILQVVLEKKKSGRPTVR